MRKIIATTLLLIVSFNLHSQSLMDLFKSSSSTSSSTMTQESITFNEESIIGTWSYSKLNVGLADNSPLKGFAGDAATKQVGSMLNGVASSVGITEKMFTTIINGGNRLVFQIEGMRANGSYSIDTEESTITFDIGTIKDIEVGSQSAKVTLYEDKVVLLFDAKELIAVADKIPSLASNSQYQMIKGVASSIEGLLLGFTLIRE